MKTIQNKVTTIDGQRTENGVNLLNYAALMKIVMRQTKPEGLSIAEMRKDFRVIDAIEAAGESIILEDADFDHFKSKMDATRWTAAHKDLIQFEDDINAIK